MIDVSYNSVRSGLLQYICHVLKNDLLDYLPKFVEPIDPFPHVLVVSFREKNVDASAVRVGFATFDKQIHFYNIKVRSRQGSMTFTFMRDSMMYLSGGK